MTVRDQTGHRERWWRSLGATRLVLLAASGGVAVMVLGSALLGMLLAQQQADGAVDALPWVWRDIIVMSSVGAVMLVAVFPPVLRHLTKQRADNSVAQQALLEATAFNEAVLDGMDAGLITLDARTDMLTVNRVARRLHGIEDAADMGLVRELIVASLRDPASGESLSADDLPIARALRGTSCETHLLLTPADGGAQLHVVVRARPIRDSSGAVIAGAAVMHDITEQVRRERELAENAAHIATLGSASRAVLREEDARLAVCDAARSVSGAAFVSLFEADGSGNLECSASTGIDLRGMRMSLAGRSHVAASFNAARTTYIADVENDPGSDRDTIGWLETMLGDRIEAAVYTPVVAAGRSIAVLITTFAMGHVVVQNLVPMLEVLAAEAGVAIEREDLLRRLHAQAVTDPLTGLGNRRAWLDGLARETARSARSGEPLGIAMLDLDEFKKYNDANGHPAGDALLAQVAAEWRVRLRGGDVICRVGGEEFGVLLPGCKPTAIFDLVEALRALVPAGQTASAGTTLWRVNEEIDVAVARADALLYEAKFAGRDRQVFRTADDTAPLQAATAGPLIVQQRPGN